MNAKEKEIARVDQEARRKLHGWAFRDDADNLKELARLSAIARPTRVEARMAEILQAAVDKGIIKS